MNAKETMEALLAGEEVRPKAESFTILLDDKGRIIQRWDRRYGDNLLETPLNQGCEIEKPKSDPKDVLMMLAEGGRIRSGEMTYWLDDGLLYRQYDGGDPVCLIDVMRCTVDKEEGEE